MLTTTSYSGHHPELTTPNRRVGPIRLSMTLLPVWLDDMLPCWESRHAFGPLYTDPDNGATGRDCYRCGQWFAGPMPDGRKLLLQSTSDQTVRASDQLVHGFFGSLARKQSR